MGDIEAGRQRRGPGRSAHQFAARGDGRGRRPKPAGADPQPLRDRRHGRGRGPARGRNAAGPDAGRPPGRGDRRLGRRRAAAESGSPGRPRSTNGPAASPRRSTAPAFATSGGSTRSRRRPAPTRAPAGAARADGAGRRRPSRADLDTRLADELGYVQRLLEGLGDELIADLLLIQRHGKSLQSLDLVGQILGHVSAILAPRTRPRWSRRSEWRICGRG